MYSRASLVAESVLIITAVLNRPFNVNLLLGLFSVIKLSPKTLLVLLLFFFFFRTFYDREFKCNETELSNTMHVQRSYISCLLL